MSTRHLPLDVKAMNSARRGNSWSYMKIKPNRVFRSKTEDKVTATKPILSRVWLEQLIEDLSTYPMPTNGDYEDRVEFVRERVEQYHDIQVT